MSRGRSQKTKKLANGVNLALGGGAARGLAHIIDAHRFDLARKAISCRRNRCQAISRRVDSSGASGKIRHKSILLTQGSWIDTMC